MFATTLWLFLTLSNVYCSCSEGKMELLLEPCVYLRNESAIDCGNGTYSGTKAALRRLSKESHEDILEFRAFPLYFEDEDEAILENNFFSSLFFKRIIIRNSGLKGFECTVFGSTAKAIEYIDLSFNFITSFDGIFDLIQTLSFDVTINLSNNMITALPNEARLELNSINLSGNELKEIGIQSFVSSNEIDLSNNKIKFIESGAFLMKSGIISLKNNSLEDDSIQSGFIDFNGEQKGGNISVNVGNNYLTYLNYEIFAPLIEASKANSLSVANNPLHCGCRMKWFLDLTTSDDSREVQLLSASCPDNRDFAQYNETDLVHCGTPLVLSPEFAVNTSCSYCEDYVECANDSYTVIRKTLHAMSCRLTRPKYLHHLYLDNMVFDPQDDNMIHNGFLDFIKVEKMSLTNSKIFSVNPNMLGLSSRYTSEIDLSNNQIDSQSNVFELISNMYNVTHVNLSRNQLTFIPGKVFEKLHSIKMIDLKNNKIKKVFGEAFKFVVVDTVHIKCHLAIYLDNNLLNDSSFDATSIQVDSRCTVDLSLKNNNLKKIDANIFKPFLANGSNVLRLNGNNINCNAQFKSFVVKNCSWLKNVYYKCSDGTDIHDYCNRNSIFFNVIGFILFALIILSIIGFTICRKLNFLR